MKFKLVGIGEVLWDMLPGGRQLGGAPANFAYHARALGADARVVSRVGNDADGRELIARLTQLGVPTDCIEIDSAAPTGTVSVAVTPDGQPHFTIHENVAWDRISGEATARRAVASADAICFGTLAQRSEPSRSTILSLVAGAPPAALRIFDVNLRQNYYSTRVINESLALANVLKLNDAELPRLAAMFDLTGDERSQIRQLAERNQLRAVACTRGQRGSLLLVEGCWSESTGVPASVVDTVGAGDAFTAAMTLGLLARWPLDEVNQRANEIGAFVCSHAGATPALPPGLRDRFESARASHSASTLQPSVSQ